MTIGMVASRGREPDSRRGGETVGGSPTSLRDGERPLSGLKRNNSQLTKFLEWLARHVHGKQQDGYLVSEMSKIIVSESLVSGGTLLIGLSGPMLPLR